MNETAKLWIVTNVEVSDSSDCVPHVLGTFHSKEEAENYIKSDIEEYCNQRTEAEADFDHMVATYNDDMSVWNYKEIEIK